MSIPQSEHVSYVQQLPGLGAVSVKLERGQRGGCAWEIRVDRPRGQGETYTDAGGAAILAVEAIHAKLLAQFGGEQAP